MDERRDTVDGVGESPHSSRGDRPMSPNSASLATLGAAAGAYMHAGVSLGPRVAPCTARRCYLATLRTPEEALTRPSA